MKPLAATKTLVIVLSKHLKEKTLFWMDLTAPDKTPSQKCAVAAMRKGYKMFAVQHGGWCAASATAYKTFDKYGKYGACQSDGEGGPWANQVYVIKGKMSLK